MYQGVTERPKVSSWPLFSPPAIADTATNTSNSGLQCRKPLPDPHTHTHQW